MVLRNILIAGSLALPACAQTLRERMDGAQEKILSKHGLEIGGNIHSQYFHAGLSGPAKVDTAYAFETTQFTAFDLDLEYRPYDFVGGKALIRFYQDWQTFFATRSRVLASRWLSVDGNIANTLAFNAGDFRQKYTPLTLWTPELDLVYEPLIFARERRELMDEQFLGDNQRPLQGVNLNLARRFASPVSEARLDAIASRVRRGEFLDRDGSHGSELAKSDMDRFFLAARTEAFLMDGAYLGGSFLSLLDDRDSYQLLVISPELRKVYDDPFSGLPSIAGVSLNGDSLVIARDLRVVGAHGGVDLAGMLGLSRFTLELLGEYAQSGESNRFAWAFRRDTSGGTPHNVAFDRAAPGRDGRALNLALGAGYQGADSAFGVDLAADYLANEAAFLNPLAQSPSFTGSRIMNTENDLAGGMLYSTFDALYDGVYKFSPSRKTSAYQHAPFSKTSYHNGVFSPEDLARFTGDPVLQLVLPFGLATPNRTGIKTRVTGHWAGIWHATLDAAVLKESEGMRVDSATASPISYTQFGGGVKTALARLIGLAHPLDISASLTIASATRDPLPRELVSPEVDARLLMAGIHYQFLPKWAVLGGYQQAAVTSPLRLLEDSAGSSRKFVYQYALDETQRHFRAGMEYTMGRNAYLMLSGGLIQVERSRVNKGSSQSGEGPNPARNLRGDFSQMLSQAVIRVKF